MGETIPEIEKRQKEITITETRKRLRGIQTFEGKRAFYIQYVHLFWASEETWE